MVNARGVSVVYAYDCGRDCFGVGVVVKPLEGHWV